MSKASNYSVVIKKHISINEVGSAEVTIKHEIKNDNDGQYLQLEDFTNDLDYPDVIRIQINDSKGKRKKYTKSLSSGSTAIKVFINEKILPSETYVITMTYTIPTMVKTFGKKYFYKDTETFGVQDFFPNADYFITFQLPKLFSRYKFWKEITVDAPNTSKIYTKDGYKFLEYNSCISKGGCKEMSFMFQEGYNSKIISLGSFVIGIIVTQIASLILDSIF